LHAAFSVAGRFHVTLIFLRRRDLCREAATTNVNQQTEENEAKQKERGAPHTRRHCSCQQTVSVTMQGPLIGVLALQGAFEEHQQCLEAVGCRTVQVRASHVVEREYHSTPLWFLLDASAVHVG